MEINRLCCIYQSIFLLLVQQNYTGSSSWIIHQFPISINPFLCCECEYGFSELCPDHSEGVLYSITLSVKLRSFKLVFRSSEDKFSRHRIVQLFLQKQYLLLLKCQTISIESVKIAVSELRLVLVALESVSIHSSKAGTNQRRVDKRFPIDLCIFDIATIKIGLEYFFFELYFMLNNVNSIYFVYLLQLILSVFIFLVFQSKLIEEIFHFHSQKAFPIFLQVYLAQNLNIFLIQTAQRYIRCQFLITLQYPFPYLFVYSINILKKSLKELFLDLHQNCISIEPVSLAKDMIFEALAFLIAAVEGRIRAVFVGADVVDIKAALALKLRF